MLTLVRADCGVLRERFLGRDDVCAVVVDGGGGCAAGVAAVWMAQRALVLGQRVWGCDVGGGGCTCSTSLRNFLPSLPASRTLNRRRYARKPNAAALHFT